MLHGRGLSESRPEQCDGAAERFVHLKCVHSSCNWYFRSSFALQPWERPLVITQLYHLNDYLYIRVPNHLCLSRASLHCTLAVVPYSAKPHYRFTGPAVRVLLLDSQDLSSVAVRLYLDPFYIHRQPFHQSACGSINSWCRSEPSLDLLSYGNPPASCRSFKGRYKTRSTIVIITPCMSRKVSKPLYRVVKERKKERKRSLTV